MQDNIIKNKLNNKTLFFIISILSIIILLILIDFFIRKTIYLKNPTSGFLYTYAKIRNIPAISIYGDKIAYVNFKNVFDKNIAFYKKIYTSIDDMPDDEYIKDTTERKMALDTIINDLCKKYDIKVSDREIYDETKKYIDQFDSKEELDKSLMNYYGIDLQFFQENYIKSYLLKNKLDSFIKTDDKINKNSLKKIEDIKNKLKNIDFLKLAKYYNEDINLQESSGVLDWISKDDLKNNFPDLENTEVEKDYTSDILKNQNGYYLIKIIDTNNQNIKDQKIKIAIIKIGSMNLSDYLQKQYNNIKIREYIN